MDYILRNTKSYINNVDGKACIMYTNENLVEMYETNHSISDWAYRYEGELAFLGSVFAIVLMVYAINILPDAITSVRMSTSEQVALQAAMDAGDDKIAKAVNSGYINGVQGLSWTDGGKIAIDMQNGIEYIRCGRSVMARSNANGTPIISPEWVTYENVMKE